MRHDAKTNSEKSGSDRANPAQQPRAKDPLEQELEDSFPASDPPQSTQPHRRTGSPAREDKKKKSERSS